MYRDAVDAVPSIVARMGTDGFKWDHDVDLLCHACQGPFLHFLRNKPEGKTYFIRNYDMLGELD